ncbi:hypothetical protein FQN54_006514 [Arachnomyces sp. PD_36]|nr:hypothetical protein FQN54_006514 [Arachnomyces sp. PD_36]
MAAPGFSVFELLRAADKAKHVYNTFYGEFDNAPARIQELAETSKYLHDLLENVRKIVEWYGVAFPGESSFSKRLEECDSFISKYSALQPVDTSDAGVSANGKTIQHKVRRVWLTTRYAFNHSSDQLKGGLLLEMQKLNTFILVYALTRSIPDSDTRNSDHRVASRNTRPPASNTDEFQKLFNRLLTIRYSYERETNQAVQQNRVVDASNISRNLEGLWQELCEMAGLGDDSAPALPTERLLQSPTPFWNETVVNVTTPSIRTTIYNSQTQLLEQPISPQDESPPSPRNIPSPRYIIDERSQSPCISPEPRAPSLFTESMFSGSSPGTSPSVIGNSQPRGSVSGRAPSFVLTPSALPSCKAFITLRPGRRHQLHLWHILETGATRKLIWSRSDPATTLEHHLPRDVFPYTKHSSHKNSLHVSFQDRHKLVFKRQETVDRQFEIDPEYQFINHDDLRMFQEGVRDMELSGTFEFDKLWSARKGFLGEATNETLKLWRSHEIPPVPLMTFYASSDKEQRHVELCLQWFEPQFVSDKPTNLVRLNFKRPKSGNAEHSEQGGRVSRVVRRFSFGKTSPISGSPPRFPPPDQSPPRSDSKRSSVSSVASSIIHEGRLFPPSDIVDKYRYIAIRFSTPSDFQAFVKAFEEASNGAGAPANTNFSRVTSIPELSETAMISELP